MRIALICMPFMRVESPSFGIEVLKEVLQENAISCDVFYLNLELAKRITSEMYRFLAGVDLTSSMLGDYIFSHFVFSLPTEEEMNEYMEYIMSSMHGNQNVEETRKIISKKIHKGVELAGMFLTEWEEYDWSQYDAVGFTSSFQQNMACLSLAKRIKGKWKNYILMGGANCYGVMANAIIKEFSYIDAVCNGEGEEALVELLKMIALKKNYSIPGIVTQNDPENSNLPIKIDINSIPTPNFDTYLNRMKLLAPQTLLKEVHWPYESSRGCWWGQKRQCKFCGGNGHSIEYRSKKPEKVIKELKYIKEKYGEYNDSRILMLDSIMDMNYFDTLLPKIKENNLDVSLVYETKSNLKEKHIAQLRDVRIRSIQPGIESLSTNILRLINKGVSALQNVRLLRLCTEYGIVPFWNMLCGIPGESEEDYDLQIKLIEKLFHLRTPPVAVMRIFLSRFSSYFENAESEGVKIIGENPIYRFIYRDEKIQKNKDLFYYFAFDYEASDICNKKIDSLKAIVAMWSEKVDVCDLFMDSEYMYKIENNSLSVNELTTLEKEILFLTSDIASTDEISSKLENCYPKEEIESKIIELIDMCWIIEENDKLLRLALDRKIYEPSQETESKIQEWKIT